MLLFSGVEYRTRLSTSSPISNISLKSGSESTHLQRINLLDTRPISISTLSPRINHFLPSQTDCRYPESPFPPHFLPSTSFSAKSTLSTPSVRTTSPRHLLKPPLPSPRSIIPDLVMTCPYPEVPFHTIYRAVPSLPSH